MLTFLNLLTCAWGQKTLWKNPAPLGCLFCSYKQQRGEDRHCSVLGGQRWEGGAA